MSAITNSTGPRNVCVAPAVQACSFELDVQNILDIIDKIAGFLNNVTSGAKQAIEMIKKVLDAMSGIVGAIARFFGIDYDKTVVASVCDGATAALDGISALVNAVSNFCKNATAPWQIRSAGRSINEQIVPQAQDFTESLGGQNFQSNSNWTGVAAERFRTNIQSQSEFATTLQENTSEFGQVVEQMGEEGVKTTVEFVKGFIKAAISLGKAIYKLWQVPVGTAIATKDIIALIKAIIEMVKVWVTAIRALLSQIQQLKAAAEAAAPSNEWPKIAR